jgi:hypothetical protein
VLAICSATLTAGCGSAKSTRSSLAEKQESASLSAFANAVNLRRSDLPQLAEAKLAARRVGGRFLEGRCISRSEQVAAFGSPSLVRDVAARREGAQEALSLLPIEQVHSTVFVMASPSAADRDVGVADSAAARACLRRLFLSSRAAIESDGSGKKQPFFDHIEVMALAHPALGVPSYALRMRASIPLGEHGQGLAYFADSLGLAVGRAVVSLSATGSPTPVPAATEHRLLALLYRRARDAQSHLEAAEAR